MWAKYRGLGKVDPEHVSRVLSLPRMARLHTLGLHHQKEDFRVVSLGPEEGAPSYRIYRVRRVENDHIESILRSPVQMLDLTSCDVTPVGPSILSQALRRLEGLRLLSTLITSDQMTWLFRSMTESSRLKMLSISLKSLDCTMGVKAELVGSALASLSHLNIHELNRMFVPTQIREIFSKMGEKSSKVDKLSLQTADLSYVPPQSVARALTRLKQLSLGLVSLTTEQATEFCRQLKDKESRLEELEVNTKKSSLHEVSSAGVLARGLACLKSLSLSFTCLRVDQMQELFAALAKDDSQVTHLSMSSNPLIGLNPAVLASAIPNLTSLTLRSCNISEEQGEAVMEAIADLDSFDRLDLSENRLARLAPSLLAAALNKVRVVTVTKCGLDHQQLTAILEEARIETRMTAFYIDGNSTGSLSKVLLEALASTTLVKFSRTKKNTVRKMCLNCGKGPFTRMGQHRCRLDLV